MPRRRSLIIAICASFAMNWIGAAAGQDAKPTDPSLVVQLKSLDGMLNDVKYILKMVNREDIAEQLDGVIDSWAGDKGLAGSGIDVKRPFLVYAMAKSAGNDNPFAVMIPINDFDTFLKLLDSLTVPVEKSDDGCYAVKIPARPAPMFFRLANKYLYVTAMDKANIEPKSLVAPEKLISSNENMVLGATLRIDQIPETVKKLMLGEMERRLAEVKDRKREGETTQQTRIRREGIDAMAVATKTILNDGKFLQFQWTIDRAKHDINLSLALEGKPGTAMASVIGALSGGPSKFAPAQDAAFHVGLNFALPDFIKPFVGGLVDIGTKDIVARESDPTKREVNTKVLEAVAPTLKNGVLDFHIVAGAKGTGGKFNLVAALGVENGQGIEGAVKELLRTIPADQQAKVKLNASKAGDVNLHEIKVDGFDAQAKRLFGDNANVWAGFSERALMLGVGSNSNEVFKSVQGNGPPVPSPLLVIEGSLGTLAATNPDENVAKIATEVFGKAPPGADRFRLSLEGGKQLKLNLSFKGQAITFGAEMQQRRNQ